MRPPLPLGRGAVAVATTVLAFLATAVAAAPWLRAFPEATAVPLLGGAAALSVLAVPLLAIGARRSASWSIALNLLGLATYCLVVVLGHPDQPGLLADGLTHGLSRLLSTALPVSSPRFLLVPPVVLTWSTGAITSELAIREPASASPAVCWPVSFALAYAVTAGAPGGEVSWAIALLVVVGVFVAVRHDLDERGLPASAGTRRAAMRSSAAARTGGPGSGGRPRRSSDAGPSRRKALLLAATSLAGATLFGAFGVPALPFLRSSPLAPTRHAPVVESRPLTPTAAMVELRAEPNRPLYRVVADRATPGYVTLADLDRYDGSSWSLDATFLPTGGRVPLAEGTLPAPAADLVVQRYQVLRSAGLPWMPVLSRPVSVSGVDVTENAALGMVVPTASLSAGEAYTVVSGPVSPTLASLAPDLTSLRPGGTPDAEDSLIPVDETRDLDDVTTLLTRETGDSTSSPLAFLEEVEQEWSQHYRRIATTGAKGPAAANDTTFADVANAVIVNRKATPEQFATLFALLARHLGVPARLVTGFRLTPLDRAQQPEVAGRVYTIDSNEAWTWVELSVAGLGWVLADPTPVQTGAPVLPAFSTTPSSTSTTIPAAQAVPVPTDSGHALAPPVSVDLSTPVAGSGWLAALIGAVVALVLLVPLGLLGRKRARRRRRRTAAEPSARVVGAWLEALDTLEESALGDLRPLTGEEVVAAAGSRFGTETADRLRAVAEGAGLALFSPATPLDGEQAEAAWRELGDLRRLVRGALPLRARLLAALRYAPSRRGARNDRLRSGATGPGARSGGGGGAAPPAAPRSEPVRDG